jgi:hypothetical protein
VETDNLNGILPSNPNFENIRIMADLFRELPNNAVSMGLICEIDRDSETVREAMEHSCGTVGCIAGWTGLRFSEPGMQLIAGFGKSVMQRNQLWVVATRALGLNEDEVSYMFYGRWHPSKDWLNGNITRREVVAYLDKVVATKNVMYKLSYSEVAFLAALDGD